MANGAVSKRAGKASAVQFVNTTSQSVIDWEVAEQAENIDTSALDDYNSITGVLNKTSRIGPQYCTWKLAMIWNASQNFYDDPPGFFPSDLTGPLKVILNIADNTFWNFPIVTINSCRLKGGVKGAILFDVDGESSGPYTRPTGSNSGSGE